MIGGRGVIASRRCKLSQPKPDRSLHGLCGLGMMEAMKGQRRNRRGCSRHYLKIFESCVPSPKGQGRPSCRSSQLLR